MTAPATIHEFESSTPATRLRDNLNERMQTMITRYRMADEAVRALRQSIGCETKMPYAKDAFESVFELWLSDAIRRFEAEGQGVGNAAIERSELSENCCYVSVSYDLDTDRGQPLEQAADELIATFDFEQLVADLSSAADGLENKGLREAADRLVDDLSLNKSWRLTNPPKRTGRHWVFTARMYVDSMGYDYRLIEGLNKLARAFGVAADDAGLDGVEAAMNSIVGQINEAKYKTLPSRTKLGNAVVEGVIFKEKLELRVSPDVGDGLLAFIALHTSRDVHDLEGTQ